MSLDILWLAASATIDALKLLSAFPQRGSGVADGSASKSLRLRAPLPLQALNFACAKWSTIPAADLSELPAELLLELLGSEVRNPESGA